jgi:hypothetical protein
VNGSKNIYHKLALIAIFFALNANYSDQFSRGGGKNGQGRPVRQAMEIKLLRNFMKRGFAAIKKHNKKGL